jgi:hypothetical protein
MTVSRSSVVREITVVNTRLMPRAVRPPMWRRSALGGMALFCGFFVNLSLRSFW